MSNFRHTKFESHARSVENRKLKCKRPKKCKTQPKKKKRPVPKSKEELLERQAENREAFMKKMERQEKRMEKAKYKKLLVQQQWDNLGT